MRIIILAIVLLPLVGCVHYQDKRSVTYSVQGQSEYYYKRPQDDRLVLSIVAVYRADF